MWLAIMDTMEISRSMTLATLICRKVEVLRMVVVMVVLTPRMDQLLATPQTMSAQASPSLVAQTFKGTTHIHSQFPSMLVVAL
jgi:hypothetical protein